MCVLVFICLLLLTRMMKAEVSCDCVSEFFNLALAKLCTGENQQFEFAERKYMSLSRNVL